MKVTRCSSRDGREKETFVSLFGSHRLLTQLRSRLARVTCSRKDNVVSNTKRRWREPSEHTFIPLTRVSISTAEPLSTISHPLFKQMQKMDTIDKPYLAVYPTERVTSSTSTASSRQWTSGHIDLHLSRFNRKREREGEGGQCFSFSLSSPLLLVRLVFIGSMIYDPFPSER